jgi:hypothetical protein
VLSVALTAITSSLLGVSSMLVSQEYSAVLVKAVVTCLFTISNRGMEDKQLSVLDTKSSESVIPVNATDNTQKYVKFKFVLIIKVSQI